MLRTAVDERRHPRIVATHHRFPEGRPGHPLIINASEGGACLWIANPPAESQEVTLRFSSDGNDLVLHSRVVWSRPCAATTSPSYLKRAVGWLAGIAFTPAQSDTGASDIPHELLRDGHVTISFEQNQTGSALQNQESGQQGCAQSMILLDEKSMQSVKAATRDLMPLFAKHFSDVHVVLKQQQLEISATFRDPDHAGQSCNDSLQARQPESGSVATVSPAGVTHQPDRGNSEKPSFSLPRRRALIAISGVVAIAAAVIYKGGGTGHKTVPADRFEASTPQADVPAWASTVGATLVDDWLAVQSGFALSDATVQGLIALLQHNDIYPPAHDLYDLAKYPRQVYRAFNLIGSEPVASTDMPALGRLKNDLESRLIAGARFPDEPPGGRYSSLQRELYNNVVVLGVVDQLHRRQDDPVVRQLFATIASSGTAKANTLKPTPASTIGPR